MADVKRCDRCRAIGASAYRLHFPAIEANSARGRYYYYSDWDLCDSCAAGMQHVSQQMVNVVRKYVGSHPKEVEDKKKWEAARHVVIEMPEHIMRDYKLTVMPNSVERTIQLLIAAGQKPPKLKPTGS